MVEGGEEVPGGPEGKAICRHAGTLHDCDKSEAGTKGAVARVHAAAAVAFAPEADVGILC